MGNDNTPQGKRYVNAVGFLEDLCLGNVETDVPPDGLRVKARVRVIQMPVASADAGYESSTGNQEIVSSARVRLLVFCSVRVSPWPVESKGPRRFF